MMDTDIDKMDTDICEGSVSIRAPSVSITTKKKNGFSDAGSEDGCVRTGARRLADGRRRPSGGLRSSPSPEVMRAAHLLQGVPASSPPAIRVNLCPSVVPKRITPRIAVTTDAHRCTQIRVPRGPGGRFAAAALSRRCARPREPSVRPRPPVRSPRPRSPGVRCREQLLLDKNDGYRYRQDGYRYRKCIRIHPSPICIHHQQKRRMAIRTPGARTTTDGPEPKDRRTAGGGRAAIAKRSRREAPSRRPSLPGICVNLCPSVVP
jgi:hypothetical protein